MKSREIIQRTLEYTGPERVARTFPNGDLGGSDFVSSSCTATTYATLWDYLGEGRWERLDEWGNTWGRIDTTSKGEVTKGVLADWDDLKTYSFPDFSKVSDYDCVRKQREAEPDKWLIGQFTWFHFQYRA